MGLLKTIPNKFGGDTTYWKISQLNINWTHQQSHVVLEGWVNQQARTDLLSPTDSRSFDWSGDNFPFLDEEPQNERETAYTAIKSQVITNDEGTETPGEFSDATDA